jgi:hypothetical protein
LQALIVGLANLGLGVGWASVVVGVVLAIIGAILVSRGQTNISPSSLTPDATVDQLRKDVEVAREQIS